MDTQPFGDRAGLASMVQQSQGMLRFGLSSVTTPQDVTWLWVFRGHRGAGPNCDSRMRVAIPLGQSGTLEQEGATWRLGGVLWVWRLLTWIFSSESALEPRLRAGRPGSPWRKPLSLASRGVCNVRVASVVPGSVSSRAPGSERGGEGVPPRERSLGPSAPNDTGFSVSEVGRESLPPV